MLKLANPSSTFQISVQLLHPGTASKAPVLIIKRLNTWITFSRCQLLNTKTNNYKTCLSLVCITNYHCYHVLYSSWRNKTDMIEHLSSIGIDKCKSEANWFLDDIITWTAPLQLYTNIVQHKSAHNKLINYTEKKQGTTLNYCDPVIPPMTREISDYLLNYILKQLIRSWQQRKHTSISFCFKQKCQHLFKTQVVVIR